jgi:hypothetical protein
MPTTKTMQTSKKCRLKSKPFKNKLNSKGHHPKRMSLMTKAASTKSTQGRNDLPSISIRQRSIRNVRSKDLSGSRRKMIRKERKKGIMINRRSYTRKLSV